MKTTIDAAGRVVVPKAMREASGLGAGAEVEIRCRDGVIEIEPAPMEVRLVRRGLFKVAVPVKEEPPLTAAEVEGTREGILDGRRRSVGAD